MTAMPNLKDCLLCGKNREVGTTHEPTGVSVCVVCRDAAAREQVAPREYASNRLINAWMKLTGRTDIEIEMAKALARAVVTGEMPQADDVARYYHKWR